MLFQVTMVIMLRRITFSSGILFGEVSTFLTSSGITT